VVQIKADEVGEEEAAEGTNRNSGAQYTCFLPLALENSILITGRK
jgi:hypothetical protein